MPTGRKTPTQTENSITCVDILFGVEYQMVFYRALLQVLLEDRAHLDLQAQRVFAVQMGFRVRQVPQVPSAKPVPQARKEETAGVELRVLPESLARPGPLAQGV